jgi:hypothetical protein
MKYLILDETTDRNVSKIVDVAINWLIVLTTATAFTLTLIL